jgi:hypothetical protein
MQPTPKSAHIDSALSNVAIGYRPAMFVADRVAPYVPVKKQSDYFFKFRKGAWFRNEARMRGPGAIAARGGYPLTSDTYSCKEYAFGHPVPIELLNNADQPLQPFSTAVKYAMRKVLLAKEVLVSAACMTTGNWTTSDDVEGHWLGSDASNTFIYDVLNQKETIRKLIGIYPNRMIIEAKTFNQIKQTSGVLDRIKYTGTQGRPADVTMQTLAQLFELDEVMLAGSIYSDAEEVVAGTDFNAVDLWEKTATKGAALLYYSPPAPAIDEPAAAYCFNWKGDAGMGDAIAESDIYRQVRYWWQEDQKSYIVEASEYFDFKITCADAGCLFYDTILD